MDGLEIFNFTLRRVPDLVRETLGRAGCTVEDVDAFIFHQANAFILERVAKKLGIPPARVPVNIGKYGNTSSVTIPLVIADALASRVTDHQQLRVLMAGFGVGFSWAGAAMTLADLQAADVIQLER